MARGRLLRSPWLAVVLLSAFLLSSPSLWASSPSDLAGRMETGAGGIIPGETFEWYTFVGVRPMDTGDTVIVEFAIIPFASLTSVGLDAEDGTTFMSAVFENGRTQGGLVYRERAWNDVKFGVRFSDDSYFVSVNGLAAGPFSFPNPSDSIQAFRVNAHAGSHEIAWIDTVSVVRSAGAATETLLEVNFEAGATFNLYQGSLVAASPSDSGTTELPASPAPFALISLGAAAGFVAGAAAMYAFTRRRRGRR